jgi:hypothetical protein
MKQFFAFEGDRHRRLEFFKGLSFTLELLKVFLKKKSDRSCYALTGNICYFSNTL